MLKAKSLIRFEQFKKLNDQKSPNLGLYKQALKEWNSKFDDFKGICRHLTHNDFKSKQLSNQITFKNLLNAVLLTVCWQYTLK